MRVNVLQGRQSINCENSVFPAFMGRPSLEKGRANRHQLQTDTTQNRRKTVIGQMLRSDSFGKLRTVVIIGIYEYDLRYKAAEESEFSRRTSRGMTISEWYPVERKPAGTRLEIPVRVVAYNE